MQRPLLFFKGALKVKYLAALIAIALVPACSASEDGLSFELFSKGVLKQDISRSAFFAGGKIYYSTMEDYNSSIENDFQLIGFSETSSEFSQHLLKGSNEIRYTVNAGNADSVILASSLDPKLLRFDSGTNQIETIFSIERASGWFHQIAYYDNFVYALLSHPNPVRPPYNGLLKINSRSGDYELLPFSDASNQGYGGVQSVDPSGRIWYYRAYPFELFWGEGSTQRKRELVGYPKWHIETWETFQGRYFFLLTDGKRYKKVCVDIETTTALENCDYAAKETHEKLIPLDLYGQQANLKSHYLNIQDGEIYVWRNDEFHKVSRSPPGKAITAAAKQAPQEFPVIWSGSEHGDITLLAVVEDKPLAWNVGATRYAYIHGDQLAFKQAPGENLSFSRINNLVVDREGKLFGSGLYTHANMFQLNTVKGSEATLLRSAVLGKEGQVNVLAAASRGHILGGVYPDSAIFSYDSSVPWRPGKAKKANPQNYGDIEAHNQMRPTAIVELEGGRALVLSESDYSEKKVRAIALVNLESGAMTVWNEVDNQLPPVTHLTLVDSEVVLYWNENNEKYLGTFDVDSGRVVRKTKIVLQSEPKIVHPSQLETADNCTTFLADGKTVYRINSDLSVKKLTDHNEKIERLLPISCHQVLLISDLAVSKYDSERDSTIRWTYFGSKGSELYSTDTNYPAAYYGGHLYIADGADIWRARLP